MKIEQNMRIATFGLVIIVLLSLNSTGCTLVKFRQTPIDLTIINSNLNIPTDSVISNLDIDLTRRLKQVNDIDKNFFKISAWRYLGRASIVCGYQKGNRMYITDTYQIFKKKYCHTCFKKSITLPDSVSNFGKYIRNVYLKTDTNFIVLDASGFVILCRQDGITGTYKFQYEHLSPLRKEYLISFLKKTVGFKRKIFKRMDRYNLE